MKAKRPKSVLAWAVTFHDCLSAYAEPTRDGIVARWKDSWIGNGDEPERVIRVRITPVVPRRASARRKKK